MRYRSVSVDCGMGPRSIPVVHEEHSGWTAVDYPHGLRGDISEIMMQPVGDDDVRETTDRIWADIMVQMDRGVVSGEISLDFHIEGCESGMVLSWEART